MKLMLVGLQKQGKTTILAHLTEVNETDTPPSTFMARTSVERTPTRKGKPGGVCMCVCVCVCACACACACACVCVCVCVHACVCLCVHACVCVIVHACVCVCVRVCVESIHLLPRGVGFC